MNSKDIDGTGISKKKKKERTNPLDEMYINYISEEGEFDHPQPKENVGYIRFDYLPTIVEI